jgi:monoamine oxidase
MMKGFDWAMDDFSSGAFALFGPGQFRSLYPHLVRPAADSRFHIVGEAASVRHSPFPFTRHNC